MQAVTMMEMLVTMAIIAVLGAIGLSVSARMSQYAKNTQCLSNLRQWGVVFNLYAADNNGKFPPSFPFDDGLRAWYNANCPLVTNYLPNDNNALRRWNKGLGINGCPAHPVLYDSYVYNFHLGNPNPGAVGANGYFGYRSLIKSPANVLMIADAPTNLSVSGFSRFTPERIGKCHDGRFNAAYVDGHVENRTEVDPKQIFPE